MLLYYMFVTLTSRIVQTGELDMTTATDIYEGLLSRYLLYPVPYPVLKYAQALGALAPLMLQLVVFGSVAPLFFRDGADARISIASILMFAISIFLANLLHFILMLPIQSVAFWADNVWSLAVAMRFLTTLCGGLMLPLELFPAWARPIVEASPFPYLFYTPARVLLGNASPSEWVIGLAIAAAWCVVLTIILRWVWRRGELEYTGVGI
jgi:ABC-2 type transport system permease protein